MALKEEIPPGLVLPPGSPVGLRTGLAAVDSLAVIRGGGAWLSDPALALLYHATPLAFIGNNTSGTYIHHNALLLTFLAASKLNCQVYPDILKLQPNKIHDTVEMMIASNMNISLDFNK